MAEQVSFKRWQTVDRPTLKLKDTDTWELPVARYHKSDSELLGWRNLRSQGTSVFGATQERADLDKYVVKSSFRHALVWDTRRRAMGNSNCEFGYERVSPHPVSAKHTRKSKGTHLLPTLTKLLSTSDNWFEIWGPDDWKIQSRSLWTARVCTWHHNHSLFYIKDDQHFLFKGKPRAPRKVTVTIDEKEELYYRIVPCGGVKYCSIDDCSYTTSIKEKWPCPDHADVQLTAVRDCPVEFVCVWPVNDDDKRRWLSGIVRRGHLSPTNLHNHPLSWSN